jgi:hypothetical protein
LVWVEEALANKRCGFRIFSLLHDKSDFWIRTSATTTATYTNMSDTEKKPVDEVMAAGEDETNEEVGSPSTGTYTYTQRDGHIHTEMDKY